jgi:heme/copper-type cytochrome/quinol oxidase subunit 2
VPVRLVRLAAALVGLAVTTAMTGCAGSAPAAEPSRDSSAATSVTPEPATPASATGRRIEVEVTGDRVSGDTGRVTVPAGEQVTLAVTSDVADEVHVHGYDLTAEMVPGEPEELTFTATIPGVFEVELHDAGTLLLSLQVG